MQCYNNLINCTQLITSHNLDSEGETTSMNEDEWMKLDNQVCFSLYACSREITKLYRPVLSELGLTYTQYVTLLSLWEQDKVTMKELGARLLLDSGTLTPLLKKLEGMSLITRIRDKADERNLVIQLTDDGRELKKRAADVPKRVYGGLDITPEEFHAVHKQVRDLLGKIDALQQPT